MVLILSQIYDTSKILLPLGASADWKMRKINVVVAMYSSLVVSQNSYTIYHGIRHGIWYMNRHTDQQINRPLIIDNSCNGRDHVLNLKHAFRPDR